MERIRRITIDFEENSFDEEELSYVPEDDEEEFDEELDWIMSKFHQNQGESDSSKTKKKITYDRKGKELEE